MLISKAVADQIRAGTVTTQFRRWDVPRVKVGGTQLTPAGLIRFTRVTRVNDVSKISDRAAKAAGFATADALRKALNKSRKEAEGVYRVNLEWAGEDPRLALREEVPDDAACAEIEKKTSTIDRRLGGDWTRETLEWIGANPRVVSKRLAEQRDVDLQPMKTDIRKLKGLGLTISHEVGYELSPRGRAYLRWLQDRS